MRIIPLCVVSIVLFTSCSTPQRVAQEPVEEYMPDFRVLVFSKTMGWRHDSIPAGIAAVKQLGETHNFGVDATENDSAFTSENLERYHAVVFLNTTLDILTDTQQDAFQVYIQQGGGFVGVHAAADTEYDWPWYGELVGGYFASHPQNQTATILVTDRQHPSTAHIPFRWEHYDEWYNYKTNLRNNVHVLMAVDERTYEGGEMGHDHPIAWAHHFDGGRAFYTGLGHTIEAYSDSLFLQHLLGGIEWAAGHVEADVTATLASAYDEVVLTGELTDPMELDVTNDGRVFVIEWAGSIKIWEPDTNKMRVVGWLPVDKIIEDGLLGLALDPNFDENGWMYIYYSPAHTETTFNRLSRFTYDGHVIDMGSEIAMLEIPNQRVRCCHSGGSVQFDAEGNLYLSTGDNSGGERDHEDETIRRMADQGRTAGNTNDLRGKILRIRPQPDGSYTIPEGNLFEADDQHRGEIYTMGHRNPFRYSIDDETGWLYWGDVGPGSGGGFDEFNQAREPGFFGWPLFTGRNIPFTNYHFHGAEDMAMYQDHSQPINGSSFNTGARELPPAQPSFIPYLYGTSEEFPELGAGGMNPMGGPIFHYNASSADELAIPPYFNDKVMIYEWMRNWVQVLTLDENGDLLKIDPFLPGLDYIRPIDIEVGPHGRLYILEWGDEFWGSNANAQLVRLDYYGSAPRPDKAAPAEPVAGSVAIAAPVSGSFFEFDTPIPYEVTLHDQALADQVSIRTYTGFDTSPIPLAELNGLEGEFTIDHSFTHSPDVHYADRFAEIEACLEDDCHRVRIQPRLKEAEHYSSKKESRRVTYSARPATEHWGGTALTVMSAGEGSQLTYAPVNLAGIDSLTIRFRAEDLGRIEVRLDQPGTPSLALIEITPDAGWSVTPHQADYLANVSPEASGIQLLKEGSYDNWRELTVPVSAPAGTHTLVLNFQSETSEPFVEVDWIKVGGPGFEVRNQALKPKE